MGLLEFIYYLLTFGIAALVIYYLILSTVSLYYKEEKSLSTAQTRRFAVVLFAQNDKNTFARSLYSLSGLVYPKNKYNLYLVARDESFKCISEAKKLGATVLVPSRDHNVQDQNEIIAWAFNQISKSDESYDALLFFNSDCLVSGNYLEVMNFHLEKGSEIIQSCNKLLPHQDRWEEKILQVEFMLNNEIKPLARKQLGLDMEIRNNGVCFSNSLLKEMPWDFDQHSSVTNYGLSLQLSGIEVDFAHNAVFFSELNDYLEANYNYYLQIKYLAERRNYLVTLFKNMVNDRSLYHFNRLIDFLSPQLPSIVLFTVLVAVTTGIGGGPVVYLFQWLAILLLGICSIGISLIAAKEEDKLIKIMLFIPVSFYLRVKYLLKNFRNTDRNSREAEKKELSVPVDQG